MRTVFSTQMLPEVSTLLRTTADEVGASLTDLTELCVKYALEKLTKDKLRAWAKTLPSRRGRPTGAFTKLEKALLHAFEVLGEKEPGAKVFSVVELARAAGVAVRDAYTALPQLEARERVATACGREVDRWGRPAEFVAWLPGAVEKPGLQAHLIGFMAGLREELATKTVDPIALELIERHLREATGWSVAAMALPIGPLAETYEIRAEDASAWVQARWSGVFDAEIVQRPLGDSVSARK